MASRLLAPVRTWEARRALHAERRRADDEIRATKLPSPRLAWRVAELVADDNRVALGRSLADVVHSADERLLPTAAPLNRAAVRECRAELLDLASRLCDLRTTVAARGVLLAEELPLYGTTTSNRLRAAITRCRDELTT